MNSKTQKAIYRSYWDDGSIFGSPCEVDILSKHVEVIYPVSYTHLDVYKRQDKHGFVS